MKSTLAVFLLLFGCTASNIDQVGDPVDAQIDDPLVETDDRSQEVVCDASDRPFDDDIQVTESGCILTNIFVDGNIYVRADASATLNAVAVTGAVRATGTASLVVFFAEIDGGISVVEGGTVEISQTVMAEGDLTLEANTDSVQATGNTIGGNLRVLANTGGASVTDNAVGGDLQCADNDPPPTGDGNVVDGDPEGQCAGL